MSNCLKCSYPKGEPKGSRICGKCGRPENVPKEKFQAPQEVEQSNPIVPLASLVSAPIGLPEISVTLPAHSRMGGSAAHRFLNCSGSTALVAGLKIEGGSDIDPEWTQHGTLAHALGARCLEQDQDAWELVHEYPLPPDQAQAVQVYVDYIRSLGGRRRVEVKIHLPDLHPMMFSTLDAVVESVLGPIALRIWDYKHGEGVFVEVKDNDQLKYYACMAIMEQPHEYDDNDLVELGICQPRITWADPVRSWTITVEALKRWLNEVLLPAMRLTAQDMHLQLGEWCRFCPARLVCPAMDQAFRAFSGDAGELASLSNEVLGAKYELTPAVRMHLTAIENEVKRRLLDGSGPENTKLVYGRANRVWKDDAWTVAVQKFGSDKVYTSSFISPAMMEKLPDGKEFVKEWAYTPEAGLVVALASDPKPAVVAKTPEQKYGDPAKLLDAGKLV